MKDFWEIFIIFSKIGAFTFGGGYAMLPILKKEIVEKNKWVHDSEVMDFFAIAQSLPGVIAVNVSMLIGHNYKGKTGFFAATLGVITPSILIILIIAMFLQNFMDYKIVAHAFAGITVAVVALIMNAAYNMFRSNVKNKMGLFIFLSSTIALQFFSVSPTLPIVFGAICGILFRKGKGE